VIADPAPRRQRRERSFPSCLPEPEPYLPWGPPTTTASPMPFADEERMNRVTLLAIAATAGLALTGCNDDQLTFKPIPPRAVLTGNASWSPLDIAEFDGSASSPADSIVDYHWSIVAHPDGSMS